MKKYMTSERMESMKQYQSDCTKVDGMTVEQINTVRLEAWKRHQKRMEGGR